MFYAQFVLSKKGPLAKIWLAAHWEKKLSKAQIYETSVQDAVEEILQPKVKMALRTTGHLLLGIVRIYSRKTKYLLADCNEAFLKIKMAFRPGQIELTDDGKEAPMNSITLPEVYTDFDTALPDFNDLEFANHLQVNQSRIDDITLKEDHITEPNNMFGNDFGMDDFGESAMGMTAFGLEEDFGEVSAIEVQRRSDSVCGALSLGGLPNSISGDKSSVEEAREASTSMRDLREPTPMLDGAKAPGVNIFQDDDFGGIDMGGIDDDMDGGMFHDNMSVIMPMDAPGADILTDDLQLGAAANNLLGVSNETQESFALEPLEVGALDRQQERRRRKRRLIIDEQKNIGGDEMKSNMADFTDTLQSLDLAPPTRKLMRMKESGIVEKLFHLPGCGFMKAKPLVRLYQSHLVLRARVTDDVLRADDIRKELDMSETIDEDIPFAPESNYGDDFEDIGPVPFEPIGAESPTLMVADLDPVLHDVSPLKEHEDIASPPAEKKKRKINETQRTVDDDDAAEGDEDHRWTKRTQNVLNSIAGKLRSSGEEQISMTDLLTKGSTRKTAAQKFYTLLVLKKWQAIDVEQKSPYDDILISAGPNITQTVA